MCWGSSKGSFQFRVFGELFGKARSDSVPIRFNLPNGAELEKLLLQHIKNLMKDLAEHSAPKETFDVRVPFAVLLLLVLLLLVLLLLLLPSLLARTHSASHSIQPFFASLAPNDAPAAAIEAIEKFAELVRPTVAAPSPLLPDAAARRPAAQPHGAASPSPRPAPLRPLPLPPPPTLPPPRSPQTAPPPQHGLFSADQTVRLLRAVLPRCADAFDGVELACALHSRMLSAEHSVDILLSEFDDEGVKDNLRHRLVGAAGVK